jgi:hypothetical protein
MKWSTLGSLHSLKLPKPDGFSSKNHAAKKARSLEEDSRQRHRWFTHRRVGRKTLRWIE